MSLKSWGGFIIVLAVLMVSSVSCGHDQQLVGISIVPDTETFGAPNIPVSVDTGLKVQLQALGSYIHPPVTKDITNQVTWTSNTPGIATVTSSGMLTAAGIDCGTAVVTATVQTNSSDGDISSHGAIVSGTMQANVVCFTGANSGSGPGPTLWAQLKKP